MKVVLLPEQEFRFEVDFNKQVTIKAVAGEAEIYGSELAKGACYSFTGTKLGIYSYNGCTLEVEGDLAVEYTAEETPMHSYLNTHYALENKREEAKKSNSNGPRVMILGLEDVGKTCLSKILLNYSVKQGRTPLFVELDCNEVCSVSIPGSLSATPVHKPIDPEEGFGSSPFTTNLTPICYYYGYADIGGKGGAYQTLLKNLAEQCIKKAEQDPQLNSSGFIISCPSSFCSSSQQELLQQTIDCFKVSAILVIENERLYNELRKKHGQQLQLVKLDKSGGCVNRDKQFRKQQQIARVREYFYGTPTANNRADLSPFTNIIPLANIHVRRIGDVIEAPTSALPLGTDRIARETKLFKVTPGDVLLHSVLAVSHAEYPILKGDAAGPTLEEESEILLNANIIGYIYVSEVDDNRKVMTVLCPNPTRFHRKYLIMGELKWIESS